MAAHPDFVKPFLAAQTAIKGAVKDSTNPHFKNRYADLESVIECVKPALAANGFCFSQGVSDDCTRMITTIIHITGHAIACSVPLIIAKQDMQAVGSAITYARRYGLAAALGVPQIDDDAESTMERPKPAPSYKPTPAALPPMPAVLINRPFKYSDHRDLVPNAAAAVGIPANKIIEVREKLSAFLEANASTHDLPQWIDAFFKKEGDK